MNCGQVMWWMKECARWKDIGRHLGYDIDEMAIAFPNDKALEEFLRSAIDCGLENFNNVNDTVLSQNPRTGVTTAYEAHYRFLRMPDSDWRLEAMTARSFLHHELFRGEQVPQVVHASWKLPSMTRFLGALAECNRKGYGEEMFCASSYGLFSYRRPLVNQWPLGKVFLKPRLPWSSVITTGPLP